MRTVKDVNITSRTARSRLPVRHKPYFKSLEAGQHIGYRKGLRGGVWLARTFIDGKYIVEHLGTADDQPNVPGAIDYATAVAQVREWCKAKIKMAKLAKLGDVPAHVGPYRVRDAARDYLADYKLRGRGIRTVEPAINHHVAKLGNIEVSDLTTARVRAWHQAIAISPPKRRTGKLASAANVGQAPSTPEQVRARRATANFALSMLKALLNFGFREGKIVSDEAWRRVKPFHDVSAPRIRYLHVDEAQRLMNACPPDLRDMVQAAVLTGCRYSELTRLVASDFNASAHALLIQHSKNGKSRYVVLTDEGVRFFESMTAGKSSADLIFTHSDGSAWGQNHQRRPMYEACEIARIQPAVGFHVLRHTHASLLVQSGAPLQVIAAQLGHADTRITERHYAHLSPSYVADTIRATLPTFGIVGHANIKPLQIKKG